MKHSRDLRVRNAEPRANYHPGNVTTDATFKHDDAPPMSERVVIDRAAPVLYDANERPIYRKVGFTR